MKRAQSVIAIGLGLLLLGALFHVEVVAAVQTWLQSTAYNHCFLVLPIVAYLLRERRADITGLAAVPAAWTMLLGLPVGAIWLLAERLGIMEGRQLAAVTFVQLLLLTVLGPRLWWAMAGPLLYLYFLVPFGEFLTPWLQDITTLFIRHGLDLAGIPAYIDGYAIEIPQGSFLVAEACAGLRFLIASIAFGCLYALLMYRDPARRAVFILVSIITPIVANGLRGLGIVYLGYRLNSAEAAAADHLIYGWIFFSVVILLLIVLGLPFRQDGYASPSPRPAPLLAGPSPLALALVALGMVLIASIGPALSAGFAIGRLSPIASSSSIEIGPDCSVIPTGPVVADGTGVRTQRVVCGGIPMDMAWEVFPTRATAAVVMAERRRLCQPVETEQRTESWLATPAGPPRAWRIMRSAAPAYTLAVSIWVNGAPARPGLRMRLDMAWNSLFGSAFAPMIVMLTPAVAWDRLTAAGRERADAAVPQFLLAHKQLDAQVAAHSAVP